MATPTPTPTPNPAPDLNQVRDKFGELACRIFRLLLRKKGGGVDRSPLKLELKQLAELALLPEREVCS